MIAYKKLSIFPCPPPFLLLKNTSKKNNNKSIFSNQKKMIGSCVVNRIAIELSLLWVVVESLIGTPVTLFFVVYITLSLEIINSRAANARLIIHQLRAFHVSVHTLFENLLHGLIDYGEVETQEVRMDPSRVPLCTELLVRLECDGTCGRFHPKFAPQASGSGTLVSSIRFSPWIPWWKICEFLGGGFHISVFQGCEEKFSLFKNLSTKCILLIFFFENFRTCLHCKPSRHLPEVNAVPELRGPNFTSRILLLYGGLFTNQNQDREIV